MTDIEKIRHEIDMTDERLLKLFVERMRLCEQIGDIKRLSGTQTRDPSREERVIERASANAGEYSHYARALFDTLMSLSRRRQRGRSGVCGLIGETLKHSASCAVHASFGLDGYRLIELARGDISDFLNKPDNLMINVTIPYKREAAKYADELTDDALATGCVNSIKFVNGRKIGGNTDVAGFMYAINRRGISVSGRSALIFGNGGGARAAKAALEKLGAKRVRMLSHAEINARDYENEYENAEIIVNATPVGMFPNFEASPCAPVQFKKAFLAIDLTYNPFRTRFLLKARNAGMTAINGLAMLVAQARECEEWCLGEKITDVEVERAIHALSKDSVSIALVGMPGAGKSAIGARLAQIMGRKLVETDELTARNAGMSAGDIIRRYGEADFRSRETQAIKAACRERGSVIATGGGCAQLEENRLALKAHCVVYHIRRDISLLSTEGRPLSEGADLYEMEKARIGGYTDVRDFEIANDTTVEAAAEAIKADFERRTKEGFGII